MSSEQRKKKVLFLTDSTIAHTGFGRAAKSYIEYLYKTGKYEIIHVASGMTDANPGEMERFAWKTYPAVNLQQLNILKNTNDKIKHESIERLAGYGAFVIDDIVKKEKPDLVIAVQDIWGIDFCTEKSWFNKIPCVLWTTLDSLPILPRAVELAPKVKHYWCWADFATKALHKMGHNHIKTVRGPLETDLFKRLSDPIRADLRLRYGLNEDDFIILDVFRNQLRKSVPNALDGFKLFKKDAPKSKLFFHTSWAEGWDIPRLIKETGLNNEDILTTYICRNCFNYEIKPFIGHDLNCRFCHAEKSQVTTHPSIGVNESQLNEIYNIADVFLHAFTSGGQEIPIQEAKLTELITLVTNYSCGEDSCENGSGSLPLRWEKYLEPGTQFWKATTLPSSIHQQLLKVYKMPIIERRKLGKLGREWTIKNFSIKIIGKQLEEFIDNSNYTPNPEYSPTDELDDEKWILETYSGFIGQLPTKDKINELSSIQ